jgi:hypothetical protein
MLSELFVNDWQDLPDLNTLVLQPEQSVFSLDFVALEYQRPKNNRYAYFLDGFDKEWNYVGTQRSATYTNLSPGSYIFKVKATNSDGIWGENPVELRILVLPPWYQTWWAYLLYALAIASIIYGFVREIQIREAFKTDIRLKEIEKERIRELEQVKTSFFTNISHELRTPLTLIISPIEKYFLKNDSMPKEQLSRLKAVHLNAQKLLRLINQLLDLSKIEAGKQGLENVSQDQIIAMGKEVVKEKYGNLFDMYAKITGEDPYEVPMRIYPAVHYTMGGLWVDYELQTTVPGLYALGEANFSEHGANRLGASALMQGLADGYFVIPYTIGNYLADEIYSTGLDTNHPAFADAEKEVLSRIEKLMSIKGTQTVESFHKRLGKIIWDKCGMARNAEGLKQAIAEVQALKKEFWSDVRIPGEINEMNPELDKANRVADFIELGELMCVDALNRNESCGGHFREEYQTEDGEALRDDENFMYVASWEFKGEHNWELHKEELKYEVIKPSQRNYK